MKNLKNYIEFVNENIYDGKKEKRTIKPDIYVVKLDQTGNWREDIQEKAGKIWGVYLVDKSEVTHLASLQGSYYLYWLYNIVENVDAYREGEDYSDELFEIENETSDDQNIYVDVHTKFDKEHKADIDEKELEEAIESEEDYDNFIERQKEYYKGNHIF